MTWSRRTFLKHTAVTAAGIAAGAHTFLGAASDSGAAHLVRSWRGRVVRIAIPPGSTYEGIATAVLNDRYKAAFVRLAYGGNKDVSRVRTMDIPISQVTPELRVFLEEGRFREVVLAEDGNPADVLRQACVLDTGKHRFHPERTMHALLVLNGRFEHKPRFHAGDHVIIPTAICRPKEQASTKPEQHELPVLTYQLPVRLYDSWADVEQRLVPMHRYGARRPANASRRHHGLDIPCPEGTPLYPITFGTIVNVFPQGLDAFAGVAVVYDTIDGWRVQYFHLSRIHPRLRSGSPVQPDTVLGWSGITGNASSKNPHVHIQMSRQGTREYVNPEPFVAVGTRQWVAASATLTAVAQKQTPQFVHAVDD